MARCPRSGTGLDGGSASTPCRGWGEITAVGSTAGDRVGGEDRQAGHPGPTRGGRARGGHVGGKEGGKEGSFFPF